MFIFVQHDRSNRSNADRANGSCLNFVIDEIFCLFALLIQRAVRRLQREGQPTLRRRTMRQSVSVCLRLRACVVALSYRFGVDSRPFTCAPFLRRYSSANSIPRKHYRRWGERELKLSVDGRDRCAIDGSNSIHVAVAFLESERSKNSRVRIESTRIPRLCAGWKNRQQRRIGVSILRFTLET